MLPRSLQNLIEQFSKLPGIGPKSAARLAFYLLKRSDADLNDLGNAVLNFRKNLKFCNQCFNISEEVPCRICANEQRNKNLIMVVEEPLDVVAFEKTNEFRGVYHVLHGVINPIAGLSPDKLKIFELVNRVKKIDAEMEVILATNPSLDGEATADFIFQQIKDIPYLKVTRIARGVPVGGDLEYADEVTLMQALIGRRVV